MANSGQLLLTRLAEVAYFGVMKYAPDLDALCTILRVACRIDDAIGGVIHLVSDEGCNIVANDGLTEPFLELFQKPVAGDGTTFSQACSERRRVVVRDIELDPGFAPYRAVTAASGVAALQSTPIIHDAHALHGVLTTCYPRPCHPGPDSQDLLDCCAAIASKLLVASELEDRLNQSRGPGWFDDARPATLRPGATQAAMAIHAALPVLESRTPPELLQDLDRKLAILVDALQGRLGSPEVAPARLDPVEKIHCH